MLLLVEQLLISQPAGGLLDFAFSVPRAGTVTSLSAFFSVTLGVTLFSPVTVTATLYRAPAGSNIFSPTAAVVPLTPSLSGLINIGTTRNAILPFTVTVAAQDRLLMVFSLDPGGLDILETVEGFASAGIMIN
jgi:BclB C-terminal domain-containing protein